MRSETCSTSTPCDRVDGGDDRLEDRRSSSVDTLTSRTFVEPSTRTRSMAPSSSAGLADRGRELCERARRVRNPDPDRRAEGSGRMHDSKATRRGPSPASAASTLADRGDNRMRRRAEGRPPERGGDARSGVAGGARRPPRGRAGAAGRGGQLRPRRARPADGRRRGGRRSRWARAGTSSCPGSSSTSAAGSASRRPASTASTCLRGDGDLQPRERQRLARRGGGAGARRSSAAARTAPATVTISCAFGCPFEGRVDPGVGRGARRAASPAGSRDRARGHDRRRDALRCATPVVGRVRPVGFHGHNTRNTGYANCLAALEAGARVLDASVGGLGGCPFSPRATGNVATEDLVYLLARRGRRDRHRPRHARRRLALARATPRPLPRGLRPPRGPLAVRPRGPRRHLRRPLSERTAQESKRKRSAKSERERFGTAW